MTAEHQYLNGWSGDEKRPDVRFSSRMALRWFIELIKPAIFTRSGSRVTAARRRTAYLDGLRGFAAFIVYWQHHQLWPLRTIPSGEILESGYGYKDKWYFACLPIVRTFFTGGHFAVAVFFVISGYVLSVKPISLIHAGDMTGLANNLSAALFKRWLRLFIPIILVTGAYMTSWHLFGLWTVAPDHKPTFRAELWNWYHGFKNFSFAFREGGNPWFDYNFPTWSIPYEFRGSIIVYTCSLAFARASTNARLLCEIGLIWYFLYVVDGWYAAMFLAGMVLSELDLLAAKDDLPHLITRFKRWKTPIFYSFLAIASILSGVPSYVNDMKLLQESPMWNVLVVLKPEAMWDTKWWFLFVSAIMLVSAIPRVPWLKSFFELPINQYLGRISFSFYLIHGPILWSLGDRVYAAVGWYKIAHEEHIPGWVNAFPLPKSGPLGLEPAFLIPQLFLIPFTFWIAEIVTKLCDEPAVRLSAWLYQKTLAVQPPTLELRG